VNCRKRSREFLVYAWGGTGRTVVDPRRVRPVDPALPALAVKEEPEELPKEQPG
jgi:hypothetical protein